MKSTGRIFEELVDAIRADIRREVMSGLGWAKATDKLLAKAKRNGLGKVLRRAKGEKRTAADFDKIKSAVLAGLKGGPLRAEPLAEAIGYSTKEIRLPISKLLSEKAVKKTGQKRATVYRVA